MFVCISVTIIIVEEIMNLRECWGILEEQEGHKQCKYNVAMHEILKE